MKSPIFMLFCFLTFVSALLLFIFGEPRYSKNSEDRLPSNIQNAQFKQSKEGSSQILVEASIPPIAEMLLKKSTKPRSVSLELNHDALEQKRGFYGGSFSDQDLQQKIADLDKEMEPLIAKVNAEASNKTADADSLRSQLMLLLEERNAIGLALVDVKIRKLRHELAEEN